LAHHVSRRAPMGARVLINGIRYKKLIAVIFNETTIWWVEGRETFHTTVMTRGQL